MRSERKQSNSWLKKKAVTASCCHAYLMQQYVVDALKFKPFNRLPLHGVRAGVSNEQRVSVN
jgi:hypothetical protein